MNALVTLKVASGQIVHTREPRSRSPIHGWRLVAEGQKFKTDTETAERLIAGGIAERTRWWQ